MKKLIGFVAALWCGSAFSQATQGSLVIGAATGGSQGAGTINVAGGYYLNGSPLSGSGTGLT